MDRSLLGLMIACFFLLFLSSVLMIGYGADGLRMLQCNYFDEANMAWQVWTNINSHDLKPRGGDYFRTGYNYGYLWQTFSFGVCSLFDTLGYALDVRFIALVERAISLSSYALVLVLLYALLRTCGTEAIVACAGALLLGSSAEFKLQSVMAKPIALETLLITLSLWIAFRRHDARHALAAATAAGLAFGTKYAGIFVLPFVFLPYSFPQFASPSGNILSARRLARILGVGILGCVLFLTAWAVTNPHAITNFREFRQAIAYEGGHSSTGHGEVASRNGFLWIPVFIRDLSPAGFGVISVGLALTGFYLAHALKRRRGLVVLLSDPTFRHAATLLLFVGANLMFLMIKIRLRVPRYALYLLPGLIATGFMGLSWGIGNAPLRVRRLAYVLLILLLLPVTWNALVVAGAKSHLYETDAQKAGRWMEDNLSAETSVVADPYVYVPDKFQKWVWEWVVSRSLIESVSAQAIALSDRATGRFWWKKSGTQFSDRELVRGWATLPVDSPPIVHDLLEWLLGPGTSWKVGFETPEAVVFVLQTPSR
jgi:hypothetical protein